MSFKRIYYTKEAASKLGVDDRTLWRWGKMKGGLRMVRDGNGARLFDADQIDKLAPKVPKKDKRHKGVSFFPK